MGFGSGSLISNQYNVPEMDGVYGVFVPQTRDASLGINTSVMGWSGVACWGIPGVLLPYGASKQSMYDAFGATYPVDANGNPDVHSILAEAINSMDPGFENQIGYGSRVTDDTDVAAEIFILDASGGVTNVLTLASTGTRGNTASAEISPNVLSTTNAPLLDVTLSIDFGATETFLAIPAYVPGTNGFNAAAWQANFNAAIGNGTTQRAQSAYQFPSAGTSTLPPVAGTFVPSTALGTDGNLGVALNDFIGSPASGAPTGLYVLAPVIAGGQFGIAGNTDNSAATALIAFGKATLSVPVMTFSTYSTPAAILEKAANGMLQAEAFNVQDFVLVYDEVLGIQRRMSPLGHAVGLLAATLPEESPGNKPEHAPTTIISTDRSSSPVVAPESSTRTGAGIDWFTQQYPLSGAWGFPHGQNAGPVSRGPSSGINFVRMSYFLMLTAFGVLGPFLERLQGNDAEEDKTGTRAQIQAALKSKFGSMATARRISKCKITVDASNNAPATVDAGYLFPYLRFEFMNTVRYIVPIMDRNGDLYATIQSSAP